MQFEGKLILFLIEIPNGFPYSRMTRTTRRIFMGPILCTQSTVTLCDYFDQDLGYRYISALDPHLSLHYYHFSELQSNVQHNELELRFAIYAWAHEYSTSCTCRSRIWEAGWILNQKKYDLHFQAFLFAISLLYYKLFSNLQQF